MKIPSHLFYNMRSIGDISSYIRKNGVAGAAGALRFKFGADSYLEKEHAGNGGTDVFAHVTYPLAGNAGDTVLSHCVRETFMKFCSVKSWDLIHVKHEVTDDTVSRINRSGLLVIGGGGLFLPDTNENAVSGWQWPVSREQLDKIETPVCVFSVGYNYFPGQQPDRLFEESLNALLEKSAFFGLRNTGSVNAVKALVDEGMRDKVVWQPCTTTLISRIGSGYNDRSGGGNVVFNMAFDREDRRYGEERDAILTQVARAAKTIEDRGYRIINVCHCRDDAKILPYFDKAGVKYKNADLSRSFTDKVLSFYSEADVVIGMRGHAQMIPFGMNKEIISLGTHNKMKWFLDDINAPDWYVDLKTDTGTIGERIADTFENIHEKNREYTKERLLGEQDRLWDITTENMEKIKELQKW